MASPPESEDEESFYDEDENDVAGFSDGRSQYSGDGQSQGSRSFYSQDERSYRSGEGSYRSGEGSYRSGEGSYRSGEGSYRSGEGSYRSGEGSYRSGDGSYRSGQGSYRSGEGSYRSGEGSYRSGEGSYRSGDGSYRSGARSYRSGEGSYRSGDGSYQSGARSYRSGEGSYRSGDGSYQSGKGSYHSGNNGQEPHPGDDQSYRSGEGSYRSGEGSFQNGQGSPIQDNGSYHSGDGSYRSGEGSYRDGSYRSGDGSYRSGQGSHRDGSYRSGEGSYRSGEGSFYSDERSRRSDEGSYPDENPATSKRESPNKDNNQVPPENGGSFHSSQKSYERKDEAFPAFDEPDPIDAMISPGSQISLSKEKSPTRGVEDENDSSPNPTSPSASNGEMFPNGDSYHENTNPSTDPERNDIAGFAENPFPDEDTGSPENSFAGSNGNNSYPDQANPVATSQDDDRGSFAEDSFQDGANASYQDENSFAEEDNSFRDENSYPDGDNSYPDEENSFAGDNNSHPDEPDDRSYRSGSQSNYSDERSFQGDGSYYSREERSVNADDYDGHSQSPGGRPPRPQHDNQRRDVSYSPRERDDRSAGPSGSEASFAEEGSERTDPFRRVDELHRSIAESEFDSEAPSFAEEEDFSPLPSKSPKVVANQPEVIFEGADFNGNTIDLSQEASETSSKSPQNEPEEFNAFSTDVSFPNDENEGKGTDEKSGDGDMGDAFQDGNGPEFGSEVSDKQADGSPFEEGGTEANGLWAGDAFSSPSEPNPPDDMSGENAFNGFDGGAFESDAFGSSGDAEKNVFAKDGFGDDSGPTAGFESDPFGDAGRDADFDNAAFGEAPKPDSGFPADDLFGEHSKENGFSADSDPFGNDMKHDEGHAIQDGNSAADGSQHSYPNSPRASHHSSERSKSYHSSFESDKQSQQGSLTSPNQSRGGIGTDLESPDASFASRSLSPRGSENAGSSRGSRHSSFNSAEGSRNQSLRSKSPSFRSSGSRSPSKRNSARSASRSFHSSRNGSQINSARSSKRSERSIQISARESERSASRSHQSYDSRSPSQRGSARSDTRSFNESVKSQEFSERQSVRSGSRSMRSSVGSRTNSRQASQRSGSRSYISEPSQSGSQRNSFRSGSRSPHSSYRSRSISQRDSMRSGSISREGSMGSRSRSQSRSRRGSDRLDARSVQSSDYSRSRSRSQSRDSREGSLGSRSRSPSRSGAEGSDTRSIHSSEHSGSQSQTLSQVFEQSIGSNSRSRSASQSDRSDARSIHSSEYSRSRSDSPSGGSFADENADEGSISSQQDIPGSRSPSASRSRSRRSSDSGVGADDAEPPFPSADDDASRASEESIGIGDVFGLEEDGNDEKNAAAASSPTSKERDTQLRGENKSESQTKEIASRTTSDDGTGLYGDQITLDSKTEASGTMRSTVIPPGQSEEDDGTISTISHSLISAKVTESTVEKDRKKKKKKKKKKRKDMRSQALQDLVYNVNEAMIDLEEHEEEDEDGNHDTSAHRLLHGFDALVGVYLQLSDELELITTFSKMKKKKKDEEFQAPINALKAVLSFAETLDQLFADLNPIILDCFDEEPDEDMDDMLYRLNSLVDLLCETTHRVGDKQEWNERAETTYVTLLELMEREALELRCYFEDVDTPEYGLSSNIHEAWSATGHIEELRALQYAGDPWLFRQICYEVMVSTDQWCPDTTMLMEICGIDPSMLEEEPDPEYLEEDELAPIPQAAEHVLDKVNGDPLPRPLVMASILRRILPPRAMLDPTLLDHFTSIRNTLENPLGLSATNIVSISSIPEVINDPDALGVGGMGKTTLAAMVAQHPDVRRYFIDGVVWVYVGDKELNYNRYTQCLRELVAQLDFYQGIPLFAELLHTPGETLSKRRRREEGFMIYARDTIAELLHDRSVLIILDDVCFEPDLDWFDFAPMPGESPEDIESNCALLVTTRCRTLLPAADTVEVDMLDEADAISLLIQESGQLSHTLMAESREARSVVRECANHCLAVKSVGRWLNLKHATAGVVSSVEEIHSEVIKSMDKILKGGDHTGADMMYEVLSMSLSPAINGEPTSIIKFCIAAFVVVFCDKEYISDFALTEPTPIIPMDMSELLFETLLEMNESSLLQEGSLFYAQKKEAAVLIPEALSALGVLKVITYSDAEDEEQSQDEQKFLQVMHFIHHEYGEFLCNEEEALKELTKDAERQWNRALVEAYLSRVEEWDANLEDAGHSYALEMIISHMIRGGMYSAAVDLLADKSFVRGRLLSLGRENTTRRHIKDCEVLFKKLKERRPKGTKLEPRNVMKQAYQALGSQLALDDEDQSIEDSRIKDVEVARAHYEIGFSLAEKRCWDAAIAHWETSQELLVSALGTVEVVAGILYNIGVVYSEMNEYEQALDSLKQCLRIRGTIHGEEHILYAQTIQKIGDIFLGMSDYHEAMESYNWALDVMYIEPSHHRVEIGEILDNKGIIHYSKGEIDEALQCHQEALRSKQVDLGEDHPELAATYHHIGNCLSDQGNVDDAIVHFEEAIRLKELDYGGGPERDADVLTIEGILHNLEGNQEQGLECYEKSLQILVTKVPHRKEKVASLLHLIGCVYLMSGEQKKAMKLFEESLQARRKVLGFVHLDVASTLFNMAFLHQTRNRLDKALKCLEEALKIRQLRLPDSEKVAVTHEKIGSLARAIGKTKKAQIGFEEALRIRRLIHGEQHEAVATVLQELGDLMDDLGEYDSAMSYYIDALDIRRNRLGLDDIAVAETLYSMGYTLHNNDEPDRALVCFEESLSIRRYQLGEDSKEVGDTLNMMGFLKAKRGGLDDALTFLWDALRIRKLQDDHVKVSETLKNIGNVHREKQEHDLAVECYEECLRIRRTELGADHEKVADALIAMGNVQSDMERNDEAMRSYQEALKIRTTVFGEHDESVAAVLQYMGTMEFRASNHEKARDLLSEFIRIRRENNTKNDGDYVNVLFMIGNIHKMQGHEDEAQLCWTEAYQVFQELGLAEGNPQIAKVMNHLLKADLAIAEEGETADQKKKTKNTGMFGKFTGKAGKLKEAPREEKLSKGKKRRKGKGIQL